MTGSTAPYGLSQANLQKMQSGHEQTLGNIKNLQQMERDMYTKLDTSVGNKSLSKTEQDAIIKKINELSEMRINLFQSLKDNYSYLSGNVANTRNDLVNQIATVGVIENELNNAKQTLTTLESEKSNKLRMVEINTYYSKRYEAQADIMKWLVLLCVPLLVLAVLMNKGIIPSALGGGLITLTLIIGTIYIGAKIWDFSQRDNMNFDEYNWNWYPKKKGPSVLEYDKGQLGLTLNGDKSICSLKGELSKAMGGCVGEECCEAPTKWDEENQKCIEGFNKLATTAYNSNKDPVAVFQDNGVNVMPYTSTDNYSSV